MTCVVAGVDKRYRFAAPVRRGHNRARPKKSSPEIALNRKMLYMKSQKIHISHPILASPIRLGLALPRAPRLTGDAVREGVSTDSVALHLATSPQKRTTEPSARPGGATRAACLECLECSHWPQSTVLLARRAGCATAQRARVSSTHHFQRCEGR